MRLEFTLHSKQRLFERHEGTTVSTVCQKFNAGEFEYVSTGHQELSLSHEGMGLRLKCVIMTEGGDRWYRVVTVGEYHNSSTFSPKRRARQHAKFRREAQKRQERTNGHYRGGRRQWR